METQTTEHNVFILSSVHRRKRTAGFSVRRRIMTTAMLCVIAEGEGTLSIDGKSFLIQPFEVFYLVPGMTVEAVINSDHSEIYLICMETLTLSGHTGNWSIRTSAHSVSPLLPCLIRPQNTQQIMQKTIYIYEQFGQCGEIVSPRSQMYLQDLIFTLMEHANEPAGSAGETSGIESSISYMHNHKQTKITLDTLSSIAKLTPTAYCRKFKKVTGSSPIDYLNRLRIDFAKEQLSLRKSVNEVAASVGFGSEYYFSRLFKKVVGVPPVIYMKRKQLKIAVVAYLNIGDNLSSLGVEPAFQYSFFEFEEKRKPDYAKQMKAQMENLKNARPDLIIGDFFHLKFYDQLKLIAPTVILNYQADWREFHMRIAELVGRERDAENTFRLLENKTVKAKRRLRERSREADVIILYLEQHNLRIQGAVNHPLSLLAYTELGLWPGNFVPLNAHREDLRTDQMPEFPATNYLFIHLWGEKQNLPQLHQSGTPLSDALYIPDWLSMSWTPSGRASIIHELLDKTNCL
ncbi:AraC family transcriptional regulator [Paenibacillus peoriae]|uniref:AraC family transcriptional regulator n=1 Tax=Paenibacillus peoriae TaxID=59893 RepID=A0A7H0YFI3_9BACL|nr:helix-turn-helix domain-containing protein [Paenibacillus peoriae]QNR69841.1 AraC family transcriptional regulator [Paenibacillus peoriae]